MSQIQHLSQDFSSQLQKRPFRFYMRNHARTFSLGVLSLLLTNFFDVLPPLVMKYGIDQIVSGDVKDLWKAIGLYVLIMMTVALFRYFWRIFFGTFHHSVAEDLRNRIFSKLTTLGPGFYQQSSVGQLMSLITNDVNSFRMAIGPGVLILLDAVFLVAMILPLMTMLSWDWTWKTLILLPAVPFIMRYMEKRIHERWRSQQDRLSDVSATAQEVISGIRVIKGYAQEKNQIRDFNKTSQDYEKACNKVAKLDAAFQPVMEFTTSAGVIILLYFCSSDVVNGAISLGTFVAFHEYIRKMVWPMSAFGMGISMLEQGRASFARICELLRTESDIPDNGGTVLDEFRNLEIRNLNFMYPNTETAALRNISLSIAAGETLGVVGPVGAGKSTLMHLLCRLHPVDSGAILFNGVSIEQIAQKSLRDIVSFVPQDTFLFSDTVGANIAMGLPDFPGLEAVRRVASVVNIDNEIESLPEGYEAYLGERGVNLSGGQKQRLTVARAMIRKSPFVILDDSLSAVDVGTEQTIVQSLKSFSQERRNRRQTTLIVSHRLATLQHADRIVVLNDGAIEAVGTHQELLQSSATYRRLSNLQNEEKLADAFAKKSLPPVCGRVVKTHE